MPNSTTITYQKVNMAGTTAASFHAIKTWLEDPYLDVFKRLLQVRILTRKKSTRPSTHAHVKGTLKQLRFYGELIKDFILISLLC